jgi:hypothetical protein
VTLDEEKELERYRATLRRQEQHWQARFESQLHSDRMAGEIGLVALRTAVVLNAGAVIALLAFVGQLWDKAGKENVLSQVLQGMRPFLWGVILAGFAGLVAYFHQSFVTFKNVRALAEVSTDADKLKPLNWLAHATRGTAIAMIIFAFASFGFFIAGAFCIAKVLAH